MVGELTRHTAGPSMAGYMYQIQRVLLRMFDLKVGEAIGLEILDDLHVEIDGTPTELTQLKYHVDGQTANITDGSAELWKTLGIWAGAVLDGTLDLATVQRLVLITRGTTPPGSIAQAIEDRQSPEVIAKLLLAVRVSSSEDLQPAFQKVHDLSKDHEKFETFLSRIELFADGLNLSETTEELRMRLRQLAFHSKSLDDAADNIAGWVWLKIVKTLGKGGVLIHEDDFHAAITQIRDRFVDKSLPTRYQGITFDPVEMAGQESTSYVRQLDLVRAPEGTKQRSIVNYFRATRERNEWVAKAEILPDELTAYDSELIDRWRPGFEDVRDDLANCDDGKTLGEAGLQFFREIERLVIPVRGSWTHAYLTTGSYHALANKLRVGWHPRFLDLLQEEDVGGAGDGQ